MNNDRRKTITEAAALIAAGAEQIRQGRDLIESVKDEEAEALEAMPEGLKSGDRGQDMEAAVSLLDEAVDALDCIGLDTIGHTLEEVTGRDVAELPAAKLDAQDAEARRHDRLPAWVKLKLERIAAELASTQAKAREVYPEPGPDSFVVDDYASPHNGRAIPFERIILRGITITAEEGQTGIQLHSSMGPLAVLPQVSNQVQVEARRRR